MSDKKQVCIKDIPVGSRIIFTDCKYKNKPITWVKISGSHFNITGSTLMSENILCMKAYDAKEPNNTDNDRQRYGNNSWKLSNLRQWLNSDEKDWFKPSHIYDQAPDVDHVEFGILPYDKEPGFLTNLSEKIKSQLISLNEQSPENVSDKVFILTDTEINKPCSMSCDTSEKITSFTNRYYDNWNDIDRKITQEGKNEYNSFNINKMSDNYNTPVYWTRCYNPLSRQVRIKSSSNNIEELAPYSIAGVIPVIVLNNNFDISNAIQIGNDYVLYEDDIDTKQKDIEINELKKIIENKDKQIDTIHSTMITSKKIVDCGYKHALMIKDGYVYTCGDNSYGQLGLGDSSNRKVFTKTNMKQIKSFSCGYNHTGVVTVDGELYMCGDNSYGQLGLGDSSNRKVFTKVNNVSNVKEVNCGDKYTIIVLDNNEILSCGLNDNGQLCLNNNINKNTFTKIII